MNRLTKTLLYACFLISMRGEASNILGPHIEDAVAFFHASTVPDLPTVIPYPFVVEGTRKLALLARPDAERYVQSIETGMQEVFKTTGTAHIDTIAGDILVHDVTHLFPVWLQEKISGGMQEDGPNCLNLVLLLYGLTNEFKLVLRNEFFSSIEKEFSEGAMPLQSGDVLVWQPRTPYIHAAIYIGGGMAFDKGSYKATSFYNFRDVSTVNKKLGSPLIYRKK